MPKWTEESKKEFDRNMLVERDYMRRQFRAEQMRDYSHAAYCHEMRWRAMDAALAALRPEEQ